MSEAINWKSLTPEQRNQIVAEKVMGRKQEECTGQWIGHGYDYGAKWEEDNYYLCDGCGAKSYRSEGREHKQNPLPAYSTDIGAAWMIVDEMRRNYSGWWNINVSPDCCLPTPAFVTLTIHHTSSYECTHPSVTSAICIAALRAVGCKVDIEKNAH